MELLKPRANESRRVEFIKDRYSKNLSYRSKRNHDRAASMKARKCAVRGTNKTDK